MIAGHYGVAYLLKGGTRPKWSLTTLIAAAWFGDLLCFVFTLAGVERQVLNPSFTRMFAYQITYGPYSHGLAGAAVTSVVAALVGARMAGPRDGAILGGAVFSHYLGDIIVHGPDLAIFSGDGPKLGFGLWNYPLFADLVECGMLAAGAVLYLRATRAKNGVGRSGLLILAVIAGAITIALPWIPPPPTATQLSVGSLALLAGTLPLIAWLERQREPLPVG